MKRNHPHTVLSDRCCTKCGKRLKQNLIDRNPDADLCYKHWQKIFRQNPRKINERQFQILGSGHQKFKNDQTRSTHKRIGREIKTFGSLIILTILFFSCSQDPIIVWTVKDIVGAAFLGAIFLAVLIWLLSTWIKGVIKKCRDNGKG